MGIPNGLPAPRPLLEIGTFLLRSESELVLKSRRVVPERLLEAGFEFEFPLARRRRTGEAVEESGRLKSSSLLG